MAPSHALAFVRASVKRWQGCVQAGLLSREKPLVRGADAVRLGGRHILGGVMRESSGDPARSGEPRHARDALCAREPGDPVIARPADGGDGARGEGRGRKPSMHDDGRSDGRVVRAGLAVLLAGGSPVGPTPSRVRSQEAGVMPRRAQEDEGSEVWVRYDLRRTGRPP